MADADNSSVQIFLLSQFNSAHLFVWNLINSPCREETFTTQLSEKQDSIFKNIKMYVNINIYFQIYIIKYVIQSYWKMKLRGGYPWI